MLIQLTIKNLAIIDDLSIEFKSKMSSLTGETGAGKSIIIDALSLISKERASSDLVGKNGDKAFIEGVFELDQTSRMMLIKILGSFDEELLIVSREIDLNARSLIRINGRITTLTNIKQIMDKIVDIHSQHENQYLLNSSNHLLLLDQFCSLKIEHLKKDYSNKYQKYLEIQRQYQEFIDQKKSNIDLDYLRNQLLEIINLDLKEGEIEELEFQHKNISEYANVSKSISELIEHLDGDNGSKIGLYRALKDIENLKENEYFYQYKEILNDIYYRLEDITTDIKSKFSGINYNEYAIDEINSRLYEISKIQRKFGQTYLEINSKKNEIEDKIKQIENYDDYLQDLEIEKEKIYHEAYEIAKQLNSIRCKEAKKLEKLVIKECHDLYLENIDFEININSSDKLKIDGIDSVEFLISTNLGMSKRPLIKVISGGELSRLMLSLKVIFAKLYNVDLMIFDEIDNGVSGKVATAIGEKLRLLAKDCQVIVVTHMPAIAACANYQYLIEKKVINNKTKTSISLLEHEERVKVIAKMLGSKENENAIFLARDLLEVKNETK